MFAARELVLAAGLLALTACGSSPARVFAEPPRVGTRVQSTEDLRALPLPRNKLHVAVFAFQDQTGQHRPNDNFAEYSFAVTQGGASILMNALKDAGKAQWFSVLERSRLGDLFQERQIIRANRSEHLGPNGQPLPPIGPLLNAGILLQGGIVAYEKNLLTGGFGANFLGIGADSRYRRDSVSVYLRAVSVLTGEVLVSVTTEKTIYSAGLQGQGFQYVAFNRLLQVETGITTNEPAQLAVRQAIEKAVYSLVLDGASRGYWNFADPDAAKPLLKQYLTERDGKPPEEAPSALAEAPEPPPGRVAAAPEPAPPVAMSARTGVPVPTPAPTSTPAPPAAAAPAAPLVATLGTPLAAARPDPAPRRVTEAALPEDCARTPSAIRAAFAECRAPAAAPAPPVPAAAAPIRQTEAPPAAPPRLPVATTVAPPGEACERTPAAIRAFFPDCAAQPPLRPGYRRAGDQPIAPPPAPDRRAAREEARDTPSMAAELPHGGARSMGDGGTKGDRA